MSEQSLEYELGKLGFGDVVELSLLAYQDGRAYFCLFFHNPNDKRYKPITLLLTDYTFSEFCKLLTQAETQVKKLLDSNRITALALPQITDVHFRSNLGSVNYMTRQLSVSVIVMKDGIGCLQLLAQETKGRSNSFGVLFNNDEFIKLKKVIIESSKLIIKVQSESSQANAHNADIVRNIKFVTLTSEFELKLIDARNADEAHIALKEIPLIKKEIVLIKREIEEKMRIIRADYTDRQRQQVPKIRGLGWFGKAVRTYQTADHHNEKFKLSLEIKPLEKNRQHLEGLISKLNRYVLELDKMMK